MIVIDPPAIPRSLARDRWAAVLVGAALSAAPAAMAAPDPAAQAPGPDAPANSAGPDATGDAKTGVLKPPNVDADMSKPVPNIDPGIEKPPLSELGSKLGSKRGLSAKPIPDTPNPQTR